MPDEPVDPVDPPEDPPADPPADDPPADPDDLGDAGKRALAKEREARKAAEKRAKDLADEAEKLRRSQMDEHERALAEARDEGRKEGQSSVAEKLFGAEVRALAAGKLTDPSLLSDPNVALRLLGLDEIPVADDGEINSEAISDAIGALVESKPYLAAGATPPANPNPGLGPKGQPSRQTDPGTLTDPKDVRTWAKEARASNA